MRRESEVYGAAEDSDLLARAAIAYVSSDDRVLDVGTGSGHVGLRVAEQGPCVIGSDINPHACRQARENGLETVRTDLVEGFRNGAFDLVLFNPPYLPTDRDEACDDWMGRALSGGETGRAVVEPFLERVGRVLRSDGFVLLVASSLTDIDAVEAYAESEGFESEIVVEDSQFFERLVVLRLVPQEEC